MQAVDRKQGISKCWPNVRAKTLRVLTSNTTGDIANENIMKSKLFIGVNLCHPMKPY